jgi:hypothetical protein
MAKASAVSQATVQRIWHARGLKPHLVRTFQLSNDKRFEEKLLDVVGLYLNPPTRPLSCAWTGKARFRRSIEPQPTLPMNKGRAGTMTHEYKCNGTTTLFAELNVLTGTVIGQCLPKHCNGEFLKFLRTIDRQIRKGTADPHDLGQLRDTHPSQRRRLAGEAPTLPPSLHPHLELLAQHGGG